MLITLDHETYPIERGRLAPPIVCTSWIDQGTPRLELWRDTPAREWLESGASFDGANTAYDLTCQMAMDQELLPLIVQAYADGRVTDVQLDAKLIAIAEGRMYEGRRFSLAALAEEIGLELEKNDWRLRYQALDGVLIEHWPEGAREYALWDAIATAAVRHSIERRAAKLAPLVVLGQHAQLAASADWTLHLASCWGVCTDGVRVRELADKLHAHIDQIRGDLVQAGLVRANGTRDDKAAARRMIEVMTAAGLRDKIVLTSKGEKLGLDAEGHETAVQAGLVKLDRDAAILSGDELLIARADYVSSRLLLGRADRLAQGTTVPLQTRFDSVKETFRTSSTQPREPLVGEQMQNFPRGKGGIDLRSAFTPRREGLVFVGGDVSSAEMSALAELTFKLFGWSRMGELINAGVDLHWHFGARSIGLSIDECKALPDADEHRSRAKPLNFGIPGGMGPDKIILYSRKGYGVKFTRDEVVRLRKIWFQTFPEVRKYLDWIGSHYESWTYVHPITGYVRGGVVYTDAANHGFQHLCAYAMKHALVEVTTACFDPRSPLFGYRMWNFIHDEILLEGPRDPDRASAAAFELARIASTCFNRFVPNFPTKVEAWVGRIWNKKNKTKLDSLGRIVECS